MTDERCREGLSRHGLPEPPAGELRDVRFAARDGDWYVETSEGKVYWLDPRSRTWKFCPQGSLH